MNLYIKGGLLCLIVMSLLTIPSTVSYFSDEEVSESNIFTAGVWCDDEWCLEVNTDKTTLTGIGDETKIHSTRYRNNCDHEIVIDSIKVGWNGTQDSRINLIYMNGVKWEGSEPTGHVCYVNCTVLPPPKPYQKMYFFFDGVITGPLELDFIMSDGSEKHVTWIE